MSQSDSKQWSISSYKSYPIQQQPSYADASALEQQLTTLRALPPLVHHNEIESLKQQLAQVRGRCMQRVVPRSHVHAHAYSHAAHAHLLIRR